jgi:hypothetical protein
VRRKKTQSMRRERDERKESNAKGGEKKHAIKEQSKEDKINCKKERMKTEGEE